MNKIKIQILGCDSDKVNIIMSKDDLTDMLYKDCNIIDSTVSNTQFNKILFHAGKLDERKKINCVFVKRENNK